MRHKQEPPDVQQQPEPQQVAPDVGTGWQEYRPNDQPQNYLPIQDFELVGSWLGFPLEQVSLVKKDDETLTVKPFQFFSRIKFEEHNNLCARNLRLSVG